MKRIIRTRYQHIYDENGRRLAVKCTGYMDIVCEHSGVFVRCDECGEGYHFSFVRAGKTLTKEGWK